MHALDFNNEGLAHFAFNKENIKAVWHRHGTAVQPGATFDDMLTAAGLDLPIDSAPLFAQINGVMVPVEKNKLIYRHASDTDDLRQLSIMGDGYTFVQPREAFSFIEEFTGSDDITVESLGALHDGKRLFFSCKVNSDPLEIVPGDMMENYLVCLDSYDGYCSLEFFSTFVFPVCHNTVTAGRSSATRKAKNKHTKGMKNATRVDQMREALGIMSGEALEFQKFAKALASIKMSDQEVSDFHETLVVGNTSTDTDDWSGQNRRAYSELQWLYKKGNGAELEGRAGTGYGALSSVTEWTTNVKNYKGDTDTDRTAFVLNGTGATINNKAQELLVKQYQIAA